jgi:serine/threonine protein kinase
MPQTVRDRIFVSYSHKDEAWLDRFRTMLQPAQRATGLQLWSDKRIEAGASWKDEIETAIDTARIALLLVSDDFLASDFIFNEELPRILQQHQSRGLMIRWVPLTAALVEETPLAEFQAAAGCDPARPLDQLDEADRTRSIANVCREILGVLGQYSNLDGDARGQLRAKVQAAVGQNVQLEEELGGGDFSITYAGRQGLRPVAVKAIIEPPLHSWADEAFQLRVEKAARLRDGHFIHVYDFVFDKDPRCVVMERIETLPLVDQLELEAGRRLPGSKVVSILAQLASALTEAHAAGLVYGALRPVNIFLDAEQVRLSALDLSNEMLRSERMRGGFMATYDLGTYMTPEQYAGEPITPLSDQYSLGLLGLELLNGEPPARVRQAMDLERKRAFFECPLQAFGQWRRTHPGLAGILRRLLERLPQARFSSMAEVAERLRAVIYPRVVLDPTVEAAKASFTRCCAGNSAFYQRFYDLLQRTCPEVRPYFAALDLRHQGTMLDQAVEQMLNFQPGPEPTTLSRTALRHARLGLRPEHFDLFLEAFVQALDEFGQEGEAALDAWSHVLRPGIEYMKERCCAAAEVADAPTTTPVVAPVAMPSAGPAGRKPRKRRRVER